MTTGTLAALPSPDPGDGAQPESPADLRLAAASNLRDEAELAFGDFLFVPRSRILLRNGRPVCLGSRAFDLLHALLKSAGTLVAKGELVKQVWPSTFVDESNLRFQMACLRKALGGDRNVIKTVPGRGYIFTGRCRRIDSRAGPGAHSPAEGSPAPARGADDGRSMQLLHFPVELSQAGPEPAPRLVREVAWDVASLAILRAWNEGRGDPAPDAPSPALREPDGAQGPRAALLLPMLLLSAGPITEAGADGCAEPRTIAAIDLTALLELLRPGLDRARGD